MSRTKFEPEELIQKLKAKDVDYLIVLSSNERWNKYIKVEDKFPLIMKYSGFGVFEPISNN